MHLHHCPDRPESRCKMKVLETLKSQFEAAASKFPGLIHRVDYSKDSVVSFPAKKNLSKAAALAQTKKKWKRDKMTLQVAIADGLAAESHTTVNPGVEPGYETTDDRLIDSWISDSELGREYFEKHSLMRPKSLTWDKDTARETLKSLADTAICHIIDSPVLRNTFYKLLSENHTGGWLAVISDLQKIPKKVYERGSIRSIEDQHDPHYNKNGEPYYSIIKDVFLASALTCSEIVKGLETAEEASDKQDDRPKWTQPLSAPKWAAMFGTINPKTMRQWLKTQKIENKRVSERKWRIVLSALPADVYEKYVKSAVSITSV